MIDREAVDRLEVCVREGGVAVIPTDTVYGLACDPDDPHAVARLYALKGRDAGKPAAVLFPSRELALAALPQVGQGTRRAIETLLPGPVTLLVPDPTQRFVLASPGDAMTLGLRVPRFEGPLAPLGGLRVPLLQTSANDAGGPDPRTIGDVPDAICAGADQVLDAGELGGTPSTVVDLRRFDSDGTWTVVREGALPAAEVDAALSAL